MAGKTPEVLTSPIDWNDPRLIGYHATSIEAYKVFKATGFLPPTSYSDSETQENPFGYLCFYPTLPFRRTPDSDPRFYSTTANYMMRCYGTLNARTHFLLNSLNLAHNNLTDVVACQFLVDYPDDPDDSDLLKNLQLLYAKGIDPAEVIERLRTARGRIGVVFGLSIDIKSKYKVEKDPFDQLALRISAPKGLKREFVPNVRAIQPLLGITYP